MRSQSTQDNVAGDVAGMADELGRQTDRPVVSSKKKLVGMKSRGNATKRKAATILNALTAAFESITLDAAPCIAGRADAELCLSSSYLRFWFAPEREMLQAAIAAARNCQRRGAAQIYKGTSPWSDAKVHTRSTTRTSSHSRKGAVATPPLTQTASSGSQRVRLSRVGQRNEKLGCVGALALP